MTDYDAVLKNILVFDTIYGGMMSKEVSMLQILGNGYLFKASKFNKHAKR